MSITGGSGIIRVNNANLEINAAGSGILFSDGRFMNTAPPFSDSTNTVFFSNTTNAFVVTEYGAGVGLGGNLYPQHALSVSGNLFVNNSGTLTTTGDIFHRTSNTLIGVNEGPLRNANFGTVVDGTRYGCVQIVESTTSPSTFGAGLGLQSWILQSHAVYTAGFVPNSRTFGFFSGFLTNGGNDILCWDVNRNVGIGTTNPNPTYKLDVNGRAYFAESVGYNPAIQIGNNTTYTDDNLYGIRWGGNGALGMGLHSSTYGVFGGQGLAIHTPNAEEFSIKSTGWNTRFAINDTKAYFNGNVGIGTTNPEKVLDVIGDAQIRYNNGGAYGTVSLRLNHNAIGQGSGGGLLLQSQGGSGGLFYPEAVINTWRSGVSGVAPLIFKIDDTQLMSIRQIYVSPTVNHGEVSIRHNGLSGILFRSESTVFTDIEFQDASGNGEGSSHSLFRITSTEAKYFRGNGQEGKFLVEKSYLEVDYSAQDNRLSLRGKDYNTGSVIQAANYAGTVAKNIILNPFGGNVGIGDKTNPLAKLEVSAGSNNTESASTEYFRYDVKLTTGPDSYVGVSIFADDDIISKQYVASLNGNMSGSDERIKSNIQDISDTMALDQLRLLQPKTYQYKDTIKRGAKPVIGFIAQEVKEVIPEAVNRRKAEIPNIYEIANVSQSNVITFTNFNTSNLNANSTVINIRTVTNGDERVTLANVIDEHTIQVVEDLSKFTGSVDENGNVITETITTTYTQEEYDAVESKDGINITYTPEITKEEYDALTDEEKSAYTLSYSKTETVNVGDQIFVYGQEVDDFNFLKKESIFTIATAALQEVDRQQQADKQRIATLESQVAALLTRIEALENNNP